MSYKRFDWEDEDTWPPTGTLVLTYTGFGYAIREWDGEDWYLDDGIDRGEEVWWTHFDKLNRAD